MAQRVELFQGRVSSGRPDRRLSLVSSLSLRGAGPTLEQMAAVARLSPYHFARQFKAATGLPPHQYLIARRLERGKRLLREGKFPLVQVATRAGFSSHVQFTVHFKRLVGVTPKRFRLPAISN